MWQSYFSFLTIRHFLRVFFDLHYLCKSLYQVCLLIITLSMFNGVFFPVAILSQLKILNLDRLLNLIKMLKYYVTCIQTIHTKYFWWWSVFCCLQLLKLSVSYKFEISTIVIDAGSGFVFPFDSAFGVSFNLLWRQFFCCFFLFWDRFWFRFWSGFRYRQCCKYSFYLFRYLYLIIIMTHAHAFKWSKFDFCST